MSRQRGASSMHRAEQVAQDVIARRIPARAGELLEIIHAINPTGRSLGTADERRRYELKARLQSLLIRNFADDLVVTADAPGVVSIRHRYLGQDACHARIDELDDDARARVQWMLDVGEVGEPPGGMAPPPAARAATDTDLLDQGRRALAEFDYETARAHFERALQESNGDPTAARALLELLVDHMAADGDALALEDQLAPRAAADAEVRALLAVAAARMGDAGAASRLLEGLVGPRVAEAWKALAEDAARHQVGEELEHRIARLAEADPRHPDLVRFRDQAQRLRADARRPAELELTRLAEAGDDEATAAHARALLARWPDSRVAGRILGGIQDRRRASETERLLASARSALSNGDTGLATELCRQARSVGADTADLLEQIREAEAARERARQDAEVAAVCAQLAGADPRPGLEKLLALEPELRHRVRIRHHLPLLDWLEQVAARNKATQHGAAIDAVLAVAAAASAAERGDDEATLALLEPHRSLVISLARANELQAEARGRIAARRRTASASALAEARLALARDDLETCERLCDRADSRDLDRALRPALDQVRHELRARQELKRGQAMVDQLVASGDLVGARRELEALLGAAQVEATHAAALRRRLDDLRVELRRAWCVCTDDVGERPDHHDLVGELLGRLPYAEAALPWLAPGGRELVIASAEGPHLFLGRVSVDDGRLRERRYLRAPTPLGELISATIDGDALWLIGDAGRMLQMSQTTGEPVRWLSLNPFLTGGERIERGFVAPGGKHLWLEVSLPGGLPQDRVIEIEPGRIRRELPAARSFQPLVAGSSSGVIGTGLDGGAVRYTERGAVAEEIAAAAPMRVSAVIIDPDRELVVVGSRLDGTGEIEIVRTRAGRTIHRRTLVATDTDAAHRCVSARDLGLLAVHHHVEHDEVEHDGIEHDGIEHDDVEHDRTEHDRIEHRDVQLAVFRFADPELVPVYATPAPWDLALAQDADAAQVVCLWDSSRGVEIERLGPQPPAFGDAIGLRARSFAPSVDSHLSCGTAAEDAGDTALIFAANRAAERGDWREVRALLEGVPPDSVAPEWLAHHCHLLGLAWLRTGTEAARVRELWQLGWSREPAVDRLFKCRLDVCLEIVEPLPDPLPDAWWGPAASLVRQLRGAIASADRLTAAGQPRAALDVMRRRVVTAHRELQSAARLAAAWLAVSPSRNDDRFCAAIALARFNGLVARRAPGPSVLDLPIEGAWTRDQLTSLAERAAQWLAAWQA
ncbi:MAG TPA: hypothetical protein VHT91_06530 [Kofleriaceae bacterium]|nr:hypothetical protein [Kofleriaceae bacterium]